MLNGIPDDLTPLYERLLIEDVRRRLLGEALDDTNGITPTEMARLVGLASSLAIEDAFPARNLAYEIATRSVALAGSEYPGLLRGAELILTRLGNFPGRDLLRRRYPSIPLRASLLQFEMRVHEIENTIYDAGGRKRRLTDFQFEALRKFDKSRSVSLSAPTSAGKSFLLGLEVLKKLRDQKPAGIVYLAPTRALIRQVVIDLRSAVEGSNLPFPLIRSVPRGVTKENAPNGIIYVLTQERLLSLLNSEEEFPWITSLIVDEAQGIGDGARGVLLQTAIENVLFRFPHAAIIFASPLTENPEYLLDLFSCTDAAPYREQHSPVSQNLVLIDVVENEPRQIQCSLIVDGKQLALGVRKVPFRFYGVSSLRRLALFARSLISADDADNCCIVYANGARDAERIALHLMRGEKPPETVDPEIEEFIEYLKDFVHSRYGLIEVLRYGVAFHYSNMPGSVRAGVEDLFQRRKLRFLCCTSTLLQGVNLPARHIVIEAPTRGKDRPMERADFLNLAGRAGRLTREFHGNVWCLRPDRWDHPCYEGESLQRIHSSFDRVINEDGQSLQQALHGSDGTKNSETAVAVLGRLFTEFIQKDRTPDIPEGISSSGQEFLQDTISNLKDFQKRARLPADVFAKNSNVHPTRIENLYSFLNGQQDIESCLPIRPNIKGTNGRLREIFQHVQRILHGVENDSYKYHAKIAAGWIHENPLSVMVANEIAYREAEATRTSDPKPVNVRNLIYGIIDTIERELRFRYVKNLRAYHDVLAQVLRERGDTRSQQLVPIHLYLECGAYRAVPISLISLGFTRVTALLLAKRIVLPADATPEECLRRCRQAIANAANLKLPIPVLKEIAALTGG